MQRRDALVEQQHDDDLDGQELGERALASQAFLDERIEDDQAVQRDRDRDKVNGVEVDRRKVDRILVLGDRFLSAQFGAGVEARRTGQSLSNASVMMEMMEIVGRSSEYCKTDHLRA